MSKTLVLREEARDALRRSAETVARAAKVTMGPRGHHVIIQRRGRTAVRDQGRSHRGPRDRA